MIKEILMEYAPYIVIAFNAVVSMLTYRRTGKLDTAKNAKRAEKYLKKANSCIEKLTEDNKNGDV